MRTGILCELIVRSSGMLHGRASMGQLCAVVRRGDASIPLTRSPRTARPAPRRAGVVYPVSCPSAGPCGPEGQAASASDARTFAPKGVM